MSRQVFSDINDYGAADLAPGYGQKARFADQADQVLLDELCANIDRDGYVIVPGLVSREAMAELRAALAPLLGHQGRNNFEGFKTARLYSVIEKTLACNPLAEHPLAMALLERYLMPNPLLSQLQVINIYPGEDQQLFHADDGLYPVPRPRGPLSAATIWAVDDFTLENGATTVLPGSHLWGELDPAEYERSDKRAAVMPAGSMIFFLGTLIHGGGPNTSDGDRMAVTAQYCQPWCRPQENYSLSISRETARQCSPVMQSLLGYEICPPFIGFVNGRHPRRLLED